MSINFTGSVLSEYIGGGAGPVSGIVSPSPEMWVWNYRVWEWDYLICFLYRLAASTFNEGVYVWKLVSGSSMELRLRAKY